MNDRQRALLMLAPLCDRESYQVVVVDGNPPSKARPRFSKSGRPYTPKTTIEGEKRLAFSMNGLEKYVGNVAVACVFYRRTYQRIDVDNLLKAVLDAGTRAKMWDDDSQVTALIGIVEHDRDWPRAVIAFGHHASSMGRGDDAKVACEACGSLFFPAGSQRRDTARWCSRQCRTVLAERVPCPQCGAPFRRANGNQKYCSVACRGAAVSARAREARDSQTHCRHGHLLDEVNTHVLADGRRRCRRCSADVAQRQRDRREAA